MAFYNTGTRRQRFLARLDDRPEEGCWEWRGFIQDNGYGTLGKSFAHRVSYEEFVGPIPDGLVIDHLCRVRSCVNPEHLRAVPQRINLRNSETTTAVRKACPRGHPYDVDNIYWIKQRDGYRRRRCRTCRLADMRQRRALEREAS